MLHDINALKVRFTQLLDTLCNEYNFAENIVDGEPEDVWNNWEQYDDACEALDIWCATGATKFVIGDDNHDYIIKIQPPCVGGMDYCAREVAVYNAAVVNGFEDKFAWTAKLFDFHFNDSICLPVYVMEWCQCSYDMIDDEMDDWHYTKYCTSHHLDKKADDAYDKYNSAPDGRDRCYSEMMMEWAYSVWGLDFNAVVEPGEYTIAMFMRDNKINDIHAGNWGWRNNKLVLTDYSGYGADEERDIDY